MTPSSREKPPVSARSWRQEHEARMDRIITEDQVGRDRRARIGQGLTVAQMEPDWGGECDNCGASPIVPATGMCGPCTFGEADTIDGNW
jgi:hypothetical protein